LPPRATRLPQTPARPPPRRVASRPMCTTLTPVATRGGQKIAESHLPARHGPSWEGGPRSRVRPFSELFALLVVLSSSLRRSRSPSANAPRAADTGGASIEPHRLPTECDFGGVASGE